MYLFVVFKALLALGSPVGECAASMEAMRRDARSSTYNNPMAVSQILPALHQKSYLALKTKNCLNEDGTCSVISAHLRSYPVVSSFRHAVFLLLTDTLVLEPLDPVVVLPSDTKVTLMVEVVTSSGATALYSVDVTKGSSLLEALEHLKGRNVGFT